MTCPACNGTLYLLGVLGSLAHLRCRCCGMDVNAPADELCDDEGGDE